jgi:hypothetical protein
MSHLSFVINGEFVFVDVPEWATLSTARWVALNDSHNTGRSAEEWEIRTEKGERVKAELSAKASLEVSGNGIFFLSLRVGIGGAYLRAA